MQLKNLQRDEKATETKDALFHQIQKNTMRWLIIRQLMAVNQFLYRSRHGLLMFQKP